MNTHNKYVTYSQRRDAERGFDRLTSEREVGIVEGR